VCTIYSKFAKLKPDKQERILNASMKEYALRGFANASTDVIVADAGISKGALFFYFNNKKDLYLYLYDYAIEIIKKEILSKFNKDEKDIFARTRQVTVLKIEILKKYPELYDFIAASYMETATEVRNELGLRNKEISVAAQLIMNEDIDTSNFQDGIDVKTAMDIIAWSIEGFSKKEMHRVKSYELYELNYKQVLEELDIYLELLKRSFYKQ
jgi:TetR/AcrR family transcriptional regulator